jgi:hypothetical protein
VRRRLGISAFGINAYSADRDEQLIEEHDESGGGAGQHEEMYVVLRGSARFTVGDDSVEVGAVEAIFVRDPAARRGATALEDGTLVLAIGGKPGAAGPPSPWEYYFAAAPAADAGDFESAFRITSEGLETWPESASLHYNLACYAALAGRADDAVEYLRRAVEIDASVRRWAAQDHDLDSIRDRPDYPG